ncbi:MAG: RNA polymerase sigma-70 factor [Tannerellaceae bacterium]|jgi:RNA polymerase sigma-70 factor (ECF subfamily)|nr:RNA polymerase sigma-70 factor [Tannerellaceae bacterium]
MNTNEKLLTAKIRAGDTNAFKELVYLYSSRLCNWAYKITKNKYAAEDIVQDLFIQYWEKREKLEFNPSFLSYAYKSVYNASLNYLRNNRKYIYGYNIILSGLSEEETNSEESQELQRLLLKAIDKLPERCKKIFVMVTLEKKKYVEVASLLGISVNTVKVQVSKAYRVLRGKKVFQHSDNQF